jgi:uncharacterized membrane protein
MTQEQIIRSRRRFEIAGSLACAFIVGATLWDRNLPSDQDIITASEYLLLLVYLLLASCYYLGAFRLLRRLNPVPAREINLHWVYASAIGTFASFTAHSVGVWFRHRPHDLFGFVGVSVIFLALFMMLMLPVMASVISAGAIYRLVRKQIGKSGRSAEAPGI